MRVNVSGKQFVFPRTCACCGDYPLTSLTVSGTERNRRARTKGWTWDIPYCLPCKNHVKAAERIQLLALALGGAAFFAGFVSAALTARWLLGIEMTAFVLMGGGLLCWALWRNVRSQSPRNCLGMNRAVLYLGSDGSCHSFDIRSAWYAADFVRSNHRKLVNVSPPIASILGNTRHGEFQVPCRLLKS